jgi:phospholipase/carboxylesterase
MLETHLIKAREPASRRLLIALHGLGDSMEGYRWLPEELDLPWLNHLLVNAPDPYYGGYSWYDIYGDATPGISRSRNLLCDLLETQRDQGFPTEQTVLFGFSQGCLLTLEVGARYPRQLGGLVGVSGYVHDLARLTREFSPVARQQHFLVTHGEADPLIPIGPVREQVMELKAAGLEIEWHEFHKTHTIAGEAELAVIREFVRRRLAPALG